MAIWLGITRAGCVVSLINTNLRSRPLAHSINIVQPKHIIVAAELIDSLMSALPDLNTGAKTWLHGEGNAQLPRIDEEIESYARVAGDMPGPTMFDTALYIYTSGTTGLPKAAKVSHYRLMQWSHWFAGLMDVGSNDRMYNCLPMYHSVGGVLATGVGSTDFGILRVDGRDLFSLQCRRQARRDRPHSCLPGAPFSGETRERISERPCTRK